MNTLQAPRRAAILGLAVTAALALASPAFAYDAMVETCHDGDTCRLANGERIRLHGVDAPERDQPYGDQATALINRLVAGQHVDIRPTGDLSYGRTVADIIVEDGPNAGTDAGAYMVRNGYAWVELRWNLNPAAPSLQAEAQAAHRGLWAASDAIPPWVWRHQYAQPWQSYHSHTAWRR
jgi:endonuclease YncB( thermonuclease family)